MRRVLRRSWYLIELGEMKEDLGRTAESLELYRRAEAGSRRILETAPDDYLANHNLAEGVGTGETARAPSRFREGSATSAELASSS